MKKVKPLLILGSGGHCKVLIEILELRKMDIIGIVDPNRSIGATYLGIEVVANDVHINEFNPSKINLVNGIGSIPGNENRWLEAQRLRAKRFSFEQLIHPSAILSSNLNLEDGVQIMAGSVLQSNVSIGRDVIINSGSVIDHDSVIGEQSHIAPGVTISGGVKVGKRTHIGTGTVVIQDISIGDNAVIAAGSTIFKDVPNNYKLIQKKKEM